MNFILIGRGKWGKKLHKNLKKFGKIKQIIRSKNKININNLKNIQWAVVASPEKSHYKYVKFLLNNKVNVYCEKPLAQTYKQCKELINLSIRKKIRLYVNEIELLKKKKLTIKKNNFIVRKKKANYTFKDNLYKLVYHDIYLLLKYFYLNDLKIKISKKNKKFKLHKFLIRSNNKNFYFEYNLSGSIEHKINNTNLISKKNYIYGMFKKVFSHNINFKKNNERALNTSKIIDKIKKK